MIDKHNHKHILTDSLVIICNNIDYYVLLKNMVVKYERPS